MEVLKECAVLGKAAYFRCLLRAHGRQKRRNTPHLKVVIIHTRDTPCPWLKACDPNMAPDVFCQSTGCNERFMCFRTPTTSKKTNMVRKLNECIIMLSLVGVQGGVTAGRSIRIVARDLSSPCFFD